MRFSKTGSWRQRSSLSSCPWCSLDTSSSSRRSSGWSHAAGRAASGRGCGSRPALTFLGVFLVYPTIATIIRSFQNRRGNAFVGLDNYQWFFSQDDTLISLRNNVLWVILLPLLVVALGLLVAVLVDRVRYESTVKSVVFLPLAISFVAASVIWKFMYDLDPNVGTLNAVVTAAGADPIALLRSSPGTTSSSSWSGSGC